MDYLIREMTIQDYQDVCSLWERTEGLKLDESDEYENLERYLLRNPKLSYVVWDDDRIIGAVKCGQDGRRGYLYHLAVDHEYRNLGISKMLYSKCIQELKKQGIMKCTLYILCDNVDGLNYWEHNGWKVFDSNFYMLQRDLRVGIKVYDVFD